MKHALLLPVFLISLNMLGYSQQINTMKGSEICSMKKSQMKHLPDLNEGTRSVNAHTFNVLKYTLSLDIYTCFFFALCP